jgi:hypothetical protein
LKPKFASELKPFTQIVMESFPVRGWEPIKPNIMVLKQVICTRCHPISGINTNCATAWNREKQKNALISEYYLVMTNKRGARKCMIIRL